MKHHSKILTATAIGSTVAIGAMQATSCTTNACEERRPNVIFILMDDAGYGDFGCYGQTKIETPNIDALAARGIRFTDMYAGAPVSAPSRCTLLTGLHAGHAQIRSNDELTGRGDVWNLHKMYEDPTLEGQAPLEPATTTIATVMQQSGYKTAMIGKWGLGGPLTESRPTDLGFDNFYGYMCQRAAQCYYPRYLYDATERVGLDNPPMNLGDRLDEGANPYDIASYAKFKGNEYSPDLIYNRVAEFVEQNRDNEFMLMWTTTIPHSALTAPDEWVEYYHKKFGDEEPVYKGKGYFPCRYPKATYAAMISYFDYQVGKLVEHLKELGIYDNTIIFLTSDNGPTHNAYTNTMWFDSAHPFRSDKGWTKRSLCEGGIRMPFIAAWGDRLTPSVSDHVGYFPDIMPTFCDIAGCESPATDGISIYPLLTGKEQPAHEFLYWEFPPFRNKQGWLSVRMGRWKGLVRDVAAGSTDMELYDIVEDCRQTSNVAAQHPDIVERMWQVIAKEHTPNSNPLFNLDITYPKSMTK